MKESEYLNDKPEFLARIKKIPAFHHFTDDILHDILKLTKLRRYDPGEAVIHEGMFDCWIYVILSGEVEVFKGDERIGGMRRSGDIFGEMGLIDGSPRSATIRAVRQTLCLAVDSTVIDGLTEQKQELFYSILYRLCAELLASRLRVANDELYLARKELDAALAELAVYKKKAAGR